jgi:transposase
MYGLEELAAWCLKLTPEIVVMESTGVYWLSVYTTLCEAGIKPIVVNAQHVKNVKGRKTDTSDSLWIAMLARAGLLKASFVPTPEFMDIRGFARYRQKLASELTRAKNQLDKGLVEAGVRLGTVVSDPHGQSARRMVECLIRGGTAEDALAFADKRLKASPDELLLALQGKLSDAKRVLLRKMLDKIYRLEIEIIDIEHLLLSKLEPYNEALDLLETIPGVGRIGAALLLAEIGPDMEVFETPERAARLAKATVGSAVFYVR